MTDKAPAIIIDGKKAAEELTEQLSLRIKNLSDKHGVVPGLAIVNVGDDPASLTYIKYKEILANKLGITFTLKRFDADISQLALLEEIDKLNARSDIHGIIIQLPLPDNLDKFEIQNRVNPDKDVDGLTVTNVGLRVLRSPDAFVPCTPKGVISLLKEIEPDLSGLVAHVIGRSDIVGRPMSDLLAHEGCTVTSSNRETKNVPSLSREADILVSAAGHRGLVTKEYVKDGAIVIDIGIHRVEEENGTFVEGDCRFDELVDHVRAITPVPGGVGPMTVAMLMENTITATERAVAKQSSLKGRSLEA